MLLLSKNDFLYLVGFICISIVIILFLSKKFQLFDHPDNIRKLHAKPVFFTGGILVATNMLFAIKLFNFEYSLEIIFIHSLYFLIIGFFDDLYHLKPQTKLITIFIFFILRLPEIICFMAINSLQRYCNFKVIVIYLFINIV